MKAPGANFACMKQNLCDPKVYCFLLFLSEVLRPLHDSELLFQRSGCQVRLLFSEATDLLKRWLLCFLHADKMPTKLWKVDNQNESVWLPPFQIATGERARRALQI